MVENVTAGELWIRNYSSIFDCQDTNFNLTSSNTGRTVPYLMYVIPGPVICAFGIVCNALNLIVLSHKTLNESPYTYLTALSVSDLTLLTISFIRIIDFNLYGTHFKAIFDFYIFLFFGNVCFNISVWMIVALTIERAYFVHRPLRANVSRWKTRFRISGIILCCILLNVPKLFCFEVKISGDNFIQQGTPFRKSHNFFAISWVQSVLINFIPMLILTVTNTTMIIALRKAAESRNKMTEQHSRSVDRDQNRMTRTLVSIVILFFICVIPSAFVDYPIAYSLFGKGKKWDEYLNSPSNRTLIYISNLLVFTNSSLNFILYCVFNRKFRKAMTDTFRKIRVINRPSQTTEYPSPNSLSIQV